LTYRRQYHNALVAQEVKCLVTGWTTEFHSAGSGIFLFRHCAHASSRVHPAASYPMVCEEPWRGVKTVGA